MINSEFKSIEDLISAFPDENSCIEHLKKLRWPIMVISPFDPISTVYKCSNKQYRCRNTGKYFNVKTGTLFYNTKIPLQKWFLALFIISNAKNRITSVSLAKQLQITQKSAWFIMRRIKRHLGEDVASSNSNVKEASQYIDVSLDRDKMQMLQWLELIKKQ